MLHWEAVKFKANQQQRALTAPAPPAQPTLDKEQGNWGRMETHFKKWIGNILKHIEYV